MRIDVERLIEQAASPDNTIRADAILALAMLLERSTASTRHDDAEYTDLLPPQLLQTSLTDVEHKHIVKRLAQIAA